MNGIFNGGLVAKAVVIGGVIASGFTASASVNLLVNGSFETSPNPAGPLTGWTLSYAKTPGASQAPSQPGLKSAAYGTTSEFGEKFKADTAVTSLSPDSVGLNGLYLVDDGMKETLTQSIFVTAGQTYNVGFDLENAMASVRNANTSSVALSLGGVALGSVVSDPALAGSWFTRNYQYTATATGNVDFTLSYTGGNFAGGYGQDFILDRAYAIQATPEPGFYGVLAAGLLGCAFAVRRNRTRAA